MWHNGYSGSECTVQMQSWYWNHKSPGIDQIPAELIKAGGRTIHCAIHKLIISSIFISVWNKEELPEEWKGSIIVPIHKKRDKTDSNNYRGISLLPTTYKMLSNILLSRLIPYAEEVIGDHRCGFRRNRSTTDHIFCIRQILTYLLTYSMEQSPSWEANWFCS